MGEIFCRLHEGPSGPPILLVHGFPLDSRMWEPQARALRKIRSCIVPDLLGFGHTPLPEAGATLEDQADALAALLGRLGLPEVVFCGLSMGGYVALAFAARHPGLLEGLVLADTRAAADSEEGRRGRDAAVESVRAGRIKEYLRAFAGRILGPRAPDGLEPRLLEWMTSQPADGLVSALLAMRDRPDRAVELPSFTCPALVLCGEFDAITPPAEMRDLAETLPRASYAEIPGAGHISNLENPDAFNAALAGFLENLPTR